jgi:hypothetical protein
VAKGAPLSFAQPCGLLKTLQKEAAGSVFAQFHKAELPAAVLFKVLLHYTLALFLSSAFSQKTRGLGRPGGKTQM